LIIPANMAFRQIRNILFLTDLTPVYQFQQYLDEIVRIAGAMESRIHFVHFNAKAPDQGIQETESYSKILQTTGKYPQHVFRELKGSNLIRTMMQYGEEISADLMVVIKQEHSLLEALLHKSISNELSLSSSVPVLVMRENKES
jgi:nucleotide-binding universal stress UspA family protein